MNDNKNLCIVTGVTGQDGSYLAELLIKKKKYDVIGVKRRSSTPNTSNISNLLNSNYQTSSNFELIDGDITDSNFVNNLISEYKPDQVYNMAAISQVHKSFDMPELTFQVNTMGVLNILNAIKNHSPTTRFLTASTSEMYGSNRELLSDGNWGQKENTNFEPRSPYAIAKIAAHNLVKLYRESYGLHVSTSICFNHTSRRRSEDFLEGKVAKWIQNNKFYIKNCNSKKFKKTDESVDHFFFGNSSFPKLRLGNLLSYRDYSHAEDCVRAMNMIIENENPDDFIVASNNIVKIEDMVAMLFKVAGVNNWRDFIYIDPKFYRPAEVDYLRGDYSKISNTLGWSPKYSLEDICKDLLWFIN